MVKTMFQVLVVLTVQPCYWDFDLITNDDIQNNVVLFQRGTAFCTALVRAKTQIPFFGHSCRFQSKRTPLDP